MCVFFCVSGRGTFPLNSFYEALALWEQADFEHPYAISFDENVVFFDTETTGRTPAFLQTTPSVRSVCL